VIGLAAFLWLLYVSIRASSEREASNRNATSTSPAAALFVAQLFFSPALGHGPSTSTRHAVYRGSGSSGMRRPGLAVLRVARLPFERNTSRRFSSSPSLRRRRFASRLGQVRGCRALSPALFPARRTDVPCMLEVKAPIDLAAHLTRRPARTTVSHRSVLRSARARSCGAVRSTSYFP